MVVCVLGCNFVKGRIRAVLGHELAVCASFHDAASLHDHDQVRMFDGRQAVCNDQGCTALHQHMQRVFDGLLGGGV